MTIRRKPSRLVVAGSLLPLFAACPGSAWAQVAHQWVNPYTNTVHNNPVSSLVETMVRDRIQLDLTRRWMEDRAGEQAPPQREVSGPPEVVDEVQEPPASPEAPLDRTPPDAPIAHVPLEASDFVPTTRLHPTIDRFLAQASLKAAARKKIRALIVAQGRRLAAVRPNNVAIALATVIVTARALIGGGAPSTEAVGRIVRHANDDLARSATFQGMSNERRQTYYDQLTLVLGFLNIYVQAGQTDPEMHDQGAAMAAMILDSLGVPARH
jgi:hypothetical protein